jgi:GT2 family glycosyltransferase
MSIAGTAVNVDAAGGTVAVVLNYRTPSVTLAAVRSLQASRPAAPAILVVDNASGDDSADTLRRDLPEVPVRVAASNDGFSAGCNLGIRAAIDAGARRILLLNSDVAVLPDTTALLEQALAASPGVGIVGPMLLESHAPHLVESSGIAYSSFSGRMRLLGHGTGANPGSCSDLREVDAISGCAALIDVKVFERVGLLTEDYFFGFEDIDFCLRARMAGFRSMCVPEAVALHAGHQSIGRRSVARIYFAARNHLLLASRLPNPYPTSLRWLQTVCILTLNTAHVLVTSEVPVRAGLRGLLRGVRDYREGQYGAGSVSQFLDVA